MVLKSVGLTKNVQNMYLYTELCLYLDTSNHIFTSKTSNHILQWDSVLLNLFTFIEHLFRFKILYLETVTESVQILISSKQVLNKHMQCKRNFFLKLCNLYKLKHFLLIGLNIKNWGVL